MVLGQSGLFGSQAVTSRLTVAPATRRLYTTNECRLVIFYDGNREIKLSAALPYNVIMVIRNNDIELCRQYIAIYGRIMQLAYISSF